MKATVYLSRKLLNQLKVKETESKDLMLTHNLHNIIINGKRVGCSGHIQNVLNNKCVYVSTEKSCYQPLPPISATSSRTISTKTVSILCVTMQTKSKTEKQTKAARCCMAWNIGILSKMSSSV